MTDTRDQFHERESQVAPPVRSGEIAHTPTPWKVFTTPDGLKLVGIGSDDGGGICDAGFGVWSWKDAEGIANAELIVRAVNSHADMLAALKGLVEWAEEFCFGGKCPTYDAIYPARVAIAKATMTAPQSEQSPLSRETGATS